MAVSVKNSPEDQIPSDPSGRGTSAEFKVSMPARMRPYSQAEIDAVVEVMRQCESQTQGPNLRKFEDDFRAYTGAKHAFAVDNCTNALRLAGVLCRLKPGDEVIIPAYTFSATAIAFGTTDAKIIWADIDRDTWVVDPGDIARKITSRTKAIVVVHLLGMPVNMPAVLRLAAKHGLRVVEDCAQAPGASIDGRKVGTFGDFGCFSFHTAKNITTLGEGGMLTVRSDEDAKAVPGLRFNGCRPYEGPRDRYWSPAMSNVDQDLEGVWPNNFCLGEAQCALGSVLLRSLDRTNATLRVQAEKIKDALADVPEISFAAIPSGYVHIFHQFVMHYDGSASGRSRDELLDIMAKEHKIRCIVQYYPLYRYPLFQKFGLDRHDCPVLESWWDNSFSLPWWYGIPDETIDYLTSSLHAAVRKLGASHVAPPPHHRRALKRSTQAVG
jgi:perosamine synthetase